MEREKQAFENEGGHMSSTAGQVTQVAGADLPYVVILSHHGSEATEHAFHPALVSKAGRSTQARAHYCLPLDDIADLLRQLIDGDHVPST